MGKITAVGDIAAVVVDPNDATLVWLDWFSCSPNLLCIAGVGCEQHEYSVHGC